jgi:tetratricopeptide (TPR) repeat protein
MDNDPQPTESRAKRDWGLFMGGIGSISAIIGLCVTIGGGVTWYMTHRNQYAESNAKMALAQAQAKQNEYQASVQTYADILKTDPLYRTALDQQLDQTMVWTENFSVLVPEGQDASAAAAPMLDEIMPILDAGLTRATGTRAADIQAHIGWAHWLNQHVAEREFPPNAPAESDYRAALTTDPSNVYANAMLGNWMTLNGGSLAEAIQHFNSAVATGKARAFVRTLQLAGLEDRDELGARAALMKAVNEMRKDGEPLDAEDKHRALGFCCDPSVTDHAELTESLSAVPADDAWHTYLWLDDQQNTAEDLKHRDIVHDFIAANISEISGDKQKSMDEYRALQEELKNQESTLRDSVDEAIARLSRR